MEREAVLHWLEDVQTATLDSEEPDGGLLSPDKLYHSSLSDHTNIISLQSPTELTNTNPQLPHSDTGQFPYSLIPSSSFQVPQDPSSLIISKRAAFKLRKSNTLSDEIVPKSGSKLRRSSPSFDFPYIGGIRQSSPSPLPAVNPDMVLPTISLIEDEPVIPRRKPLLKESTFLAELKTKTPLQSQLLKSCSVKEPKRGKSAPASPDIPRSCKIGTLDSMSVLSIAAKSYSQGDLRQPTQVTHDKGSDTSFGSSGSCVAKRGELSDVASSSGFEMPCVSDAVVSIKENNDKLIDGARKVIGEKDRFNKPKERVMGEKTSKLRSSGSLALDSFEPHSGILQESTPANQPFSTSNQMMVTKRGPSPSLPILPSEVIQFHASAQDEGKSSKIPPFLAKRKPMQQSFSVQHDQSISDNLISSSQDTSLGLEFHDHHLGRRESHKMVKTSMADNSGLQQMSALQLLARVQKSNTVTKEGN